MCEVGPRHQVSRRGIAESARVVTISGEQDADTHVAGITQGDIQDVRLTGERTEGHQQVIQMIGPRLGDGRDELLCAVLAEVDLTVFWTNW